MDNGSPQGHKGTNLIFVAVWMFSLSVVPEKESQQNDLFSAEDVVVVFLHPGLSCDGLEHDLLLSVSEAGFKLLFVNLVFPVRSPFSLPGWVNPRFPTMETMLHISADMRACMCKLVS